MEAEGHGPRACGLDPYAALALVAVRSTDRSRAATTTPFPRKKLLGALRSALASKLADGKLTVVENFEVAEAQDQALPHGAQQA